MGLFMDAWLFFYDTPIFECEDLRLSEHAFLTPGFEGFRIQMDNEIGNEIFYHSSFFFFAGDVCFLV